MNSPNENIRVGYGYFLAVVLFNLLLGGLAFQYCLNAILGKDIPWYGDMIAGLFLGQFAFPGVVICWLLKFWMEVPFIT